MSTLAHNAVRTSLAAALLLLGMVSFSLAYESPSFIRQSVRTSWSTDDGLPQNSVQAILQTSDGYLWLGTQEGLVRFNGASFTPFTKTATGAIKTTTDAIKSHDTRVLFDVRVLFEDREHNLWIGTVGGGVMQYQDGKFHTYTTNEGLRDNTITAIRQDSKGDLWFGTRIGLDRFQQGHFVHIDLPEGSQDISVNALAVGANGDIWVGTNNGLNHIPQSGSRPATVEQPHTKIQALYVDSSGDLWIGTERLGLYRLSSGKLTHNSFPDVSILSIIENDSGLWIGTAGGGICQFTSQGKQKPECYTSKGGLSGNTVLSIFKDHEGSLWVGTPTGGLTQFRKGAFTTLDQSVPFIPSARSIYQAHDGSILVATDEGVKRYSGEKPNQKGQFTSGRISDLIKDGPNNNLAWSVIEAHDGSVWVGMDHSGLKKIVNNRVFKTYTTKNGLVDDRVYAVYQDHTGTIWAGTQGGVSRFKNGKFTNFTTKDGLSSNYVWSIFEDSGHNLWFGTYGSLNRFQNGKFINATEDRSLAINNVSYFYEDSNHILWMGTAGEGLKRLKDGKFVSYTSQDGLFDNTVWAILEDDDHKFWMSSNRGIFEVAKNELDAFAEGRISHINSKSYSPADGASAECNGGSQNPAWKTTDGRLLFACVKGVVALTPGSFSHNDLPPKVVIERVVFHGDPLQLQLNDHAEIPPEKNKLEFHFAALSYLASAKIQYRYKLEPFEKEWIPTSAREVYYTNLAPGEYHFQVIASNEDGVWNDVGAMFSFYLKPHFYQTTWFYLLWVLSAVMVGAAMYRWRARKIRKRQKELIQQVDERTAELQQQISKRLEMEQEMARTVAIVESSSDAIWSTDLRGNVITWNSGAEKLFGYSAEEMVGHSVLVIVPPERNEEVLQYFQKLRRGESVTGLETVRRAKSGQLLDLSLGLSTIWKDGTIIGISVIARDISERKRAEEALQQAKEAAEAATRAKSEFLANMSHEIRTPLNGVIGMLDLANRSGLSPEQNELLAMAQDSADTLLVVINDILDFSKVEAGKLQLDFADFDLAEIVSEAVRTVALRAYEKRLELATHISPDFPRSLLGDPNRLRQVLINLLGNAIKFTAYGQVSLRVEPERLNGDELELKFSIRDTGIGIPHEKQGMIFEPFVQGDASTTRKYGGTGLGLPISARIIALMGGRIWVESEPGEGSTFYFTAVFKFAGERVGAGKIENGHRIRGKESAHQSRILKVMVAEDNLVNQKLVVRFLEQAGHQPVVANTGKEALKMWHEDSFDAILMDVQMPEMDGLAATAAIRAAEKVLVRPHVPIIAMTAHAMKGDRERCLAAGMDAYLAKPIVLRDLLDSITRAAQNTAYQPS